MRRLLLVLVLAALLAAPPALAHFPHLPKGGCPSSGDPVHDYVMPAAGSPGGSVVAVDGNTCPPRGTFDGDYEWGLGGGVFPSFLTAENTVTAADVARCARAPFTPHHDGRFSVWDDAQGPAGVATAFVVGRDDDPPTFVAGACVLDGAITPETDCRDRLSVTYFGADGAPTDPVSAAFPPGSSPSCPSTAGVSFGPGGDGGYVVFLLADAYPPGATPPTQGHICPASWTAATCAAGTPGALGEATATTSVSETS